MAIIHKRSPEDIRGQLVRVAAQHGYTRLDRFIGSTVDIFADTYGLAYDELYSLEPQVRLDTATGEYLDSWGVLLNEPRNKTGIFEDLSFTNVYISTENGEPVSKYTIGGTGLLIPNGTRIVSNIGTHVLSLVDTVVMNKNKTFVRVSGSQNVVDSLPAGEYKIQGDITDFVVSRQPRTQAAHIFIDTPKLIVTVQQPIIVEASALDDEEYRFILQAKAKSINLSNKDKVDTILSDKRIARFVIKEFTSGSSSVAVYVEPTVSILGKSMEQSLKLLLDMILPYSTVIHVARMIGSIVAMSIELSLDGSVAPDDYNEVKVNATSAIISSIADYPSGSSFSFQDIIKTLLNIPGISNVKIISKSVNGLSLMVDTYIMRDIEYIYAVENSISVTNI